MKSIEPSPIDQPVLYFLDGRPRYRLTLRDASDREIGATSWWQDEVKAKLGTTRIPSQFEVLIALTKSEPVFRLQVEIVKHVPRLVEVVVTAVPASGEVLAKHMKNSRLIDWIDLAIGSIALDVIPHHHGFLHALSPTPKGRRSAKQAVRVARSQSKITPDFLAEVANVYRANFDRPVVAVERAFGVQHRTAANYVQKARSTGLLPPTTRGKKRI